MMNKILVFVTCSSRPEAERIADALLTARLVACASIGAEINSHYWWQGKRESAVEVPLLLKTRRGCFKPLAAIVRSLHASQVPEIVATPITAGDAAYLAWLDAQLAPLP